MGAWLLLWLIAPERLDGWAAGDVALVSALAALAAVAVFAASQLGARSSLAQARGR